MTRYLWAVLIIGGLFWPSAASAEHLEGTRAHVVESNDGTWRAAFKVELWSHRTRTSTILRLIIDQEGCHLTPLAEQTTSSLQPGETDARID